MSKPAANSKLDILRIISALAVVLLHVSSDYIDIYPAGSTNFNIAVFLNSLTRFAVPVFVMISGELFLDRKKDISIKKIWLHNILRLFVIYLVWSFGYYAFQSIYIWKFDFYRQGIVRTVTGIVYATNHLWFIGMIIGLYALTPVLKSWLKNADEKNVRYFLTIFFVFQILRTTLTLLINKSLTNEISKFLTVTEVSGYLGYYVLGFYLSEYKVKKNFKTAVYIFFPVGIVLNFLISVLMSKEQGGYTPGIYDSFGVFTFINCIAIYMIAGDLCDKQNERAKIPANIAKDTLGIYLSHIMLWEIAKNELGMDFLPMPVLNIIAATAAIFVITMLISAGLRRIPFIGRYLA